MVAHIRATKLTSEPEPAALATVVQLRSSSQQFIELSVRFVETQTKKNSTQNVGCTVCCGPGCCRGYGGVQQNTEQGVRFTNCHECPVASGWESLTTRVVAYGVQPAAFAVVVQFKSSSQQFKELSTRCVEILRNFNLENLQNEVLKDGQYVVVQATGMVAWSSKVIRFPNCHECPVGGRLGRA